MADQKFIQRINMGIVDGKPAWVFHYADGRQESFSLHLGIARQFMQGLQELVLLLEHQQAQGSGSHDGLGLHDSASVRLIGGES